MNYLILIDKLAEKSKNILSVYAVALFIVIAAADFLSGPEVGISFFYLLPISFVTWFAGTWYGVASAFTGALIWLAAELLHDKTYEKPFSPYWNACIRLSFFLVIVVLQNTLKSEQLRSRMDPLTKLGNRRLYLQRAGVELDRSSRYRRPFTIAYLDLDNFKAVNDTLGHRAGDDLLRKVARVFRASLRSTDTAARIGGDEFAILLPETDADAARVLIAKLNDMLLLEMKQNGWPVTFSIGVAVFLSPPRSVDEMIARVDSLMYAAKKTGKNNMIIDVINEQAIDMA